ncbi:hypothetical protein SSS_07793 [Sarcoptes scabiei]|uniref:Uncharacterized protein n=1 Tax=Sarcoptes scabiei TaxID=52283 RepID=A0A131ZZQ1_SARSC|nr:hypothetical protein SSS_07793 [Sarcoptes scabiei]KPM04164.1 hypothetical protein QR98_0026060 [Sarcoptes scabiei]UXI18685.1 partitioning defective 6 gamma-like [Sarcoptes scabiei]
MPQSKHLNYYGFLGLFVCLAAVASFFILRNADCSIGSGQNYDKLQPIQIAGIITGAVLFILAFFNIANVLYDIKIIFFLVVIAILGVAGVLFWGAYIAFTEPCKGFAGLNTSIFSKNAFEAEDGNNIAVMFLDIIAGLMLCSVGFTFAKRL